MTPQRILAHTIVLDGQVHRLSVADIGLDTAGLWHVSVEAFERETPSTSFYSGTIEISTLEAAPGSGSPEPPVVTFR